MEDPPPFLEFSYANLHALLQKLRFPASLAMPPIAFMPIPSPIASAKAFPASLSAENIGL
ncbi:MAG: hypothetical protein IKN82_01665 [Treponema sp.]|nr:hypothetical protein [Treponema sp.]